MAWLFLIVALGAAPFSLPGGDRSAADRALAQLVALVALAGAAFAWKLLPVGLLLLVVAGTLFGISWLRDKVMGGGGFQDLGEEQRRPPSPPPPIKMDDKEALAVLGLSPGSSPDDIRAAHRRMIARAHPDGGGSDYLAAKVNAARDTLLRGLPED